SGISRVGKINMEKPGMNLRQGHAAVKRAVDGEHHFVSACGWWITFGGGGNEAIGSAHISCGESKADRIGGTAGEHAGAVKSINVDAGEGSRATKRVDREEISILRAAVVPQPEFGIVPQECRVCRVHLQCVKEPSAADRIIGLGYGDALPE